MKALIFILIMSGTCLAQVAPSPSPAHWKTRPITRAVEDPSIKSTNQQQDKIIGDWNYGFWDYVGITLTLALCTGIFTLIAYLVDGGWSKLWNSKKTYPSHSSRVIEPEIVNADPLGIRERLVVDKPDSGDVRKWLDP